MPILCSNAPGPIGLRAPRLPSAFTRNFGTMNSEMPRVPSPPPGRDVWVGYHRDLRRLTRLRALLDFVLAELP